jgi:hypothetical protein
MASRAGEYRRLARECMATAERHVSPETRAALIAMAEVWARLADEQNAARPPRAGQAPQPTMQQQQQPQPKTDTDKAH